MAEALIIDVETRSRVDLRTRGADAYFACPDAAVIVRRELRHHIRLHTPVLVAHNAEFERAAIPALRQYTALCTSALARRLGLPAGLDALCRVLNVTQKKSANGSKLIKIFCVPQPNGAFIELAARPVEAAEFVAYCEQDVLATRDVLDAMLTMISDDQLREFLREFSAHIRINEAGCPIDLPFIRALRDRAQELSASSQNKVKALTNLNATQNVALCEFLGVNSLNAANVAALLADDDTPDIVREVLQARSDSASASVKKLDAALSRQVNGMLRGMYTLYGASRTGRFSGRGAQPQNLPRGDKNARTLTDVSECASASMKDIVKSLRGVFIPDTGGVMYACDYSNIESRILAWLAGEDWKLNIFRESDTGGPDLYTLSQARYGGDRQAAKVAELACGFQGANGALQMFAKAYNLTFTEQQAALIVSQWRKQNPKIVELWARVERAFRAVVLAQPGFRASVGCLGFIRNKKRASIILPSGRQLNYWLPKVSPEGRLTYVNYQRKGAVVDTYGGRLAENIVQAISADIMLHALCNAVERGQRVYLHTHDEIVSDSADVKNAMLDTPSWLNGCPIGVKMHAVSRYAKT